MKSKIKSTISLDEINNNKDKSVEDKSIKEKSVCNTNVDKVMQIDNAFSINILMFCNKESENKSLKLSHLKRLKNIRNSSDFLFLNAHFNV